MSLRRKLFLFVGLPTILVFAAMVATEFFAQGHGDEDDVDGPYGHFAYLSLNIEEMFVTGEPQYPVERTLYSSSILDAVMHARARSPHRIELPELDVPYRSYEKLKWQPTEPRPTGANLEPWVYQW